MTDLTSRRRRLAMIATVAAVLFPATAEAQELHPAVGGGLFVAFNLDREVGPEFGFNLWGTFRNGPSDACLYDDVMFGVGPQLRLSVPTKGLARVHLGAHVNTQSQSFGGALDVGATMTLEAAALELGAEFQFAVLTAGFRERIFFDDRGHQPQFVGGLALPRTSGADGVGTCSVDGRPLRDAAGKHRSCAIAAEADPAARWVRSAQQEIESVPAFLALAEELLAVGAPLTLVDAALDAAVDEIRHAGLAAAMARRYGARDLPTCPVGRRPPLEDRTGSLRRLAVESLVDGVVGEGRAAHTAALEAIAATDPMERGVLTRIARDEVQHAALGAKVARWAVVTGGEAVGDAVATLMACESPPS